jgi:hypothetical protein
MVDIYGSRCCWRSSMFRMICFRGCLEVTWWLQHVFSGLTLQSAQNTNEIKYRAVSSITPIKHIPHDD